jgi:RHS repeat-associated protein
MFCGVYSCSASRDIKRALFVLLMSQLFAVLDVAEGWAQVPQRDSVSDRVGATFGEFRVDESGQATYSVPLFAPPGTAGVAPKLSLQYSSAGGNGVMGKGWTIGGTSAITRCRRTREHGDFYQSGVPVDGDAAPINYGPGDAFCLDGQRLLMVNGTSYGADGSEYRLEFDPFTRITSLGGTNTQPNYSGPTSFRVQRRDGSTSEYGNTQDSRIERFACSSNPSFCHQHPATAWAINRFEDSSGNYMLYAYLEDGFAYSSRGVDFQLRSVTWTGKRVLPGQVGTASAPYAGIYFNYQPIVTANGWEAENGFQSGVRHTLSQFLESIEVRDQVDSSPRVLRYYRLDYQQSGSGSRYRVLRSITECRDATQSVCYRPTAFRWSDQDGVNYSFDTHDLFPGLGGNARIGAYRLGDVDGDGRLDIVWFRRDDPACPGANRLRVGFGDRVDSSGTSTLTLVSPDIPTFCTFLNAGNGALAAGFALIDFDGDGRDDLAIADPTSTPGGRWHIYRSLGRGATTGAPVFDFNQDLINVIIPTASSQEQMQFGDFNGDGLLDMMYPTGSNSLAIRFMTRKTVGTGFEFGPAYSVSNFLPSDCQQPGTSCNLEIFRQLTAGFGVAGDFNGDGRADVVLRVGLSFSSVAGVDLPPLTFHRTESLADEHPDFVRGFQSQRFYAFTMAGKNDSAQTQALSQYGVTLWVRNDLGPQDPRNFQFADFNGDGLPDLFYTIDASNEHFRFALNTGAGFEGPAGNVGSGTVNNVKNREHLVLADVNGDGRVDVLYPNDTATCPGGGGTSNRVFRVRRYSTLYNTIDDPTVGNPHPGTACIPGGGAQGGDLSDAEFIFGDFDGDGAVDFVKLRDRTGASAGFNRFNLTTSRAASSKRFRRRDAIVRITDGNGAITQIQYQPQTNKAIYRRLKNSRNQALFGRGSPVLDLLASEYVVSEVSSSAPTRFDFNAMSTVWYRYGGARVQSGGRGLLGYQEIVTFDVNVVDATHTATQQYYRQDFPFIGASVQTGKFILGGNQLGTPTRGTAELDECALNPEAPGRNCFYRPDLPTDACHPVFGSPTQECPLALGGLLVQASASLWSCQGSGGSAVCNPPPPTTSCPSFGEGQFASGLPLLVEMEAEQSPFAASRDGMPSVVANQQPLFAFVPRTLDLDFERSNAAITRHVCGLFAYGDTYGNATQTTVATFSAGSVGTEVARKSTLNVYVNDAGNWRLGRLVTSQVDDIRGGVTRSRITDFGYDVDMPGVPSTVDTGLLTGERIQKDISDDQDLRTLYDLDAYGNRVAMFTCSRRGPNGALLSDSQCRNKLVAAQRPLAPAGSASEAVHRYALYGYSSNGRYLITTRLPFFSGGGGNQIDERVVETVNERDEFGHAVRSTHVNGRIATFLFGSLGRPYYSADNTGTATVETYRWCGGAAGEVGCPLGQSFRRKTVTSGATTVFTYFDKLGRESIVVVHAFESTDPGRHWRATCQSHDAHGRSESETIPFFLPSTSGSGSEPVFSVGSNPCWGTGAPARAKTEYDVLGRARLVQAPDNSTVTTAYFMNTTTTQDSRGRQERSSTNALGEVVSIEQGDASTGMIGTAGSLLVTQEYDPQGNLRFVRRNAGTGEFVTERQYDSLGRLTRLIDPDRGTTNYEYTAAGELKASTNARGDRVEQAFDALGRVWRRRAGAGASLIEDTWTFDLGANGVGSLYSEIRQSSQGTFVRVHGYDAFGRASGRTTQFDSVVYVESKTYDAFGRTNEFTDVSGQKFGYSFTSRGYLHTLGSAYRGLATFYEVIEQDAWGNVTRERRANDTVTNSTFHPTRGWISAVQTTAGASLVQNWSYDFDTNGNLVQRNRNGGALVETLSYDRLDRLTLVQRTGSATPPHSTVMSFDRVGNLCSLGGAAYTYAGRAGCLGAGGNALARPHAVTAVGGTSYGYDPLGQITLIDAAGTADDRHLIYDALEQVTEMRRGLSTSPSAEVRFSYAPDGSRYRRLDFASGSLVRTTHYVGSVEVETVGAVTRHRRYLGGSLILTTEVNARELDAKFALPDHLGSVDVVVNLLGQVTETTSFDAWGVRRNASTWQPPGASLATTTRGYTGHEHVDAIGLIHMNGRIYDPALARFLQADRRLDAGIQGLNRYSYVLNNPLSRTDPTGELSTRQWGQLFMTAVMAIGTYGASLSVPQGMTMSSAMGTTGQIVYSAGMGSVAGMTASQSIKGAGWGAFSGLAFWGIGTYFESARWAGTGRHVAGTSLNLGGYAAKTLAHGVLGGIMTDLQGGRFGSGFLAAGVTQSVSGSIDRIDSANPALGFAARVSAAAVLGGTVSDITGGKFANGALTASFARAFNDELSTRALNQKERATLIREAIALKSRFVRMSLEEFVDEYPLAAERINTNPPEIGIDFIRESFISDLTVMAGEQIEKYVALQLAGLAQNVIEDATIGRSIRYFHSSAGRVWKVYSRGTLVDHTGHVLGRGGVSIACEVDSGCRFFVDQ